MESNNIDSNLKICEEIFKRKSNIYVERFMEKMIAWNLDSIYFIIGLEKKKFEQSFIEEKNLIFRIQYKNNKMLIDANEDIGIIKVLHQSTNDIKSILNDLESIDKKNFYGKHKCSNSSSLLITSLGFHVFIAIKIKEKNSGDIANMNELSNDFKSKYFNNHIFKKI
jgi:hypothetical protein